MTVNQLEIGLHGPLLIREEHLTTRHDACRIMYISDIHLRRGRCLNLSAQVLAAVQSSLPDLILLGGDLVDRASALVDLTGLVESLNYVAPVMAVAGNHDQHVGIEQVRRAVVQGGGQWVHDTATRVQHGSRIISVSGPDTPAKSTENGDVRILCAHNPRIWKTAQHQNFDLILAGHLHGCQFVAFEFRDRLFPGAIFYPYCYLNHQSGSTRLVVSRGVSDLVPIRWRCPREVLLCYV